MAYTGSRAARWLARLTGSIFVGLAYRRQRRQLHTDGVPKLSERAGWLREAHSSVFVDLAVLTVPHGRRARALKRAPWQREALWQRLRVPDRVPALARGAMWDRRHSGIVSWGQKHLLKPQPLGAGESLLRMACGARLRQLGESVCGRRVSRCGTRAMQRRAHEQRGVCAVDVRCVREGTGNFDLPSWEKSPKAKRA
jgi:hypothetical protein